MIPLRDYNPSRTVPFVTRAIIVVNVLVFFYELTLGDATTDFLNDWGVVPGRLFVSLSGDTSLPRELATVLTSMFLHGGWLHLIGNMWYLWIFGDNVEDRLGRIRYLFFYLAAGVTAGVIHSVANSSSRVPTVGASGAIAAVLGAYAVEFPRARVITLIPFFPFVQVVALPAMIVLGLWFVFQFFSGALSLAWAGAGGGGGIAWWAHIGGFLFGAILMKALARRRSRAWVE